MAENQKFEPPSGPPPSQAVTAPAQVHHDAGPYYPPNSGFDQSRGNIPEQYPPSQNPYGQYGPPQGWQAGPPGPQYGYGQPGGMYYQQGGPPPVIYQEQRGPGAGDGCCAALFGALACCCCLELLF